MSKTYDIIILTEGSDPIFQVARSLGGYKIASALRNEGYSVFVLNNFSHWMKKGNINEILDKLIGENTLWLGFSSTLFMRRSDEVYRVRHTRDGARNNILWHWPVQDEMMEPMVEHVRSKGVKIVYGGMMTPWRRHDVKDLIDYYVQGMGEIPAIDLSSHLKHGTPLQYNTEKYNDGGPLVLDYDQKGDLFDFRNHRVNYVPEDFWNAEDAMGIEFGRGCIFRCKFCAYPLIGKKKGDLSFLRCKEMIKEELQQNYDLYGTTKYVIIDDTFNEQTIKLEVIAEAIEELDLPEKLQFSSFIRIDLVAAFPEQIDLLRRINVCAWFLGVESLNINAAKAIGKGCPREKVFDTIEASKKAFDGSLSVYGSFITGLPGDTKETMNHWTQILFQRKDLFDAYSFSPLELGSGSILSNNAEAYGYIVDPETNKWKNDKMGWTSGEAVEYTRKLQEGFQNDIKVSTFFLMFYQCLGYTFDELRQLSFQELFTNEDAKAYAKEYMERTYYSKVEKFLGYEPAPLNIKYMKHLPVKAELKDALRKEFKKNKHKSKAFTASNDKVTKTLDMLQVVRRDDMDECDIANDIAWNVAKIIGCEVFPRYYKQEAGSTLAPHKDHGTATAINIILNGSGPITWDEKVDVHYEAALLNVQETHSVHSDDTRLFLKLAIFDRSYDEVLKAIKGKESELFDVEIF